MQKMKNQSAGLTLVELMVTLVVAIVLLAVGIPFTDRFIERNRMTTEANALVAALNLARSEAVKTGVTATVCAVNDPAALDPACSGDAVSWTNGFFVFLDPNANAVVDPGEQRVRKWEPLGAETRFNTAPTSVQFSATGEAVSEEEFEIETDPPATESEPPGPIRCISVNPAGQIHTEKGGCPEPDTT